MKRTIKYKIIAMSFIALGITSSFSQVSSTDFYSFRLNNMFNINAAYTGHKEGVNIILNAQTQNAGVPFSNKNFMGGIYSRISDKQAIGGKIISDSRGAFQLLKADLSYAYLLQINKDQHLNLGINAGVLNSSLVTSRIENYEKLDASDASLYNPSFNSTQFTMGVGLLYTFKQLEFSLSAPHLATTNTAINSYVNAALFYTFKASKSINVTPWFAYENIPGTDNLGSIFVKGTYNNKIWLQAGYQTNQSMNAMLGLNIDKLALGYGFRFSNSVYQSITSGSHEISLKYQILARNKNKKASTSLDKVLRELNKLLNTPATEENKKELRAKLGQIKTEILKAEIDNSNPEKAKVVEKQLLELNDKLIILEQRLKTK